MNDAAQQNMGQKPLEASERMGTEKRRMHSYNGCHGRISPLRKVVKFSPGEIFAEQAHTSPQLQRLCVLRRAKRTYERACTNRLLCRVVLLILWLVHANPKDGSHAHCVMLMQCYRQKQKQRLIQRQQWKD